jgi:hypothetical protein
MGGISFLDMLVNRRLHFCWVVGLKYDVFTNINNFFFAFLI